MWSCASYRPQRLSTILARLVKHAPGSFCFGEQYMEMSCLLEVCTAAEQSIAHELRTARAARLRYRYDPCRRIQAAASLRPGCLDESC